MFSFRRRAVLNLRLLHWLRRLWYGLVRLRWYWLSRLWYGLVRLGWHWLSRLWSALVRFYLSFDSRMS